MSIVVRKTREKTLAKLQQVTVNEKTAKRRRVVAIFVCLAWPSRATGAFRRPWRRVTANRRRVRFGTRYTNKGKKGRSFLRIPRQQMRPSKECWERGHHPDDRGCHPVRSSMRLREERPGTHSRIKKSSAVGAARIGHRKVELDSLNFSLDISLPALNHLVLGVSGVLRLIHEGIVIDIGGRGQGTFIRSDAFFRSNYQSYYTLREDL